MLLAEFTHHAEDIQGPAARLGADAGEGAHGFVALAHDTWGGGRTVRYDANLTFVCDFAEEDITANPACAPCRGGQGVSFLNGSGGKEE